ncbi:hypothetical protein ACFL5B_02340 [Candidatus Latescibacterota bacterium]
MKSIVIIWLIFAVLYLTLGYLHWRAKDIKMPYISMLAVNGISAQKGMDKHIDDLNNFSKRQNYYTSFGYFLASAIALFSMVLGIRENIKLMKLEQKQKDEKLMRIAGG